MSKLAATAGATVEETLATASQVSAVEGSDINDGWIIDRTKQIDCGNGQMKFSIDLPGDTEPFECTPFQIDQKRGMMLMWMGAVRGGIIERGQLAAARSKEQALAALRAKQLEGKGIDIPATVDEGAVAAIVAGAPSKPAEPPASARTYIKEHATPASAPSADPAEYARQQFGLASAELDHWSKMELVAAGNKKAAQQAALKWKSIVDMFEGTNV